MATIKIEIDSDGEYCGDCEFMAINAMCKIYCDRFEVDGRKITLDHYKPPMDISTVTRCQQCLDAEINDKDSLT